MRIAVALALVLTIAAVWVYSSIQQHLDAPVNLQSQTFDDKGRFLWHVARGSNLNQINRQLHERQVLSHPRVMSAYATITGRTEIQAGSYLVAPADSARSLLSKFNRGDVVREQITFPEGWSFKQWRNHLAAQPQFSSIATMTVDELLLEAGIDVAHPEGWFFLDTYGLFVLDFFP